MGRKCCVPTCKSTVNNMKVRMHRCPRREPEIVKQWLKAIGKEHLLGDPKAHENVICDNHFSDKQKYPCSNKNRTNLVFDAIPDKELPNNETASISNSHSSSLESNISTSLQRSPSMNDCVSPNIPEHISVVYDCVQAVYEPQT